MLHCRHCQDSRNIRMYEQHPVVDYAKARLRRVLPRAPHHTSHSHRRRWMACSLDGASFHLADDARFHRRYHVVCAAVTDCSVSSVLSYAQQVLAERNRLAGPLYSSASQCFCSRTSLSMAITTGGSQTGISEWWGHLHLYLQDSPFTG